MTAPSPWRLGLGGSGGHGQGIFHIMRFSFNIDLAIFHPFMLGSEICQENKKSTNNCPPDI